MDCKNSVLLFVIILCAFGLSAQEVYDESSARRYCDRSPLMKIEGIWEFPSDGTRVLVRKASTLNKDCNIILLSSPDCRLMPGDTIGKISPSPDGMNYHLSLSRTRSRGFLQDMGHCAAKLSSSGASITIKPRKFKLSLGSLWFLPKIWRTLKVSLSDPAGELPQGMIKIYPPALDRNSQPVYL